MESAPVLVFIGILVFLAHLFVALFERTRVPDVLYLILIGVVIGPVLHIVSPEDFGKIGHIFTTIALVVILFEGGLELRVEQLLTTWRGTLVVTIICYMLAWAALSATAVWLMQMPFPLALFLGAALAGPAPAVVIPLARQMTLSPAAGTMLMLEAPLGEALSIIVSLTIIESVRLDAIHIGHVMGKLISSFAFALVIGALGGFLWSVLLHRIRQLRHAIFTTPSFILVLFGLTEFLGFSGPVAALTFGIILGNLGTKEIPWLARKYNLTPLQHNETEKAFFGEIVFLIKTFFFVYLGLSITLTSAWTLVVAAGLTGTLLLARLLAVRLSIRKDWMTVKDASNIAVMIPKGTAAAVLASIPLQMSLANGAQIRDVTYAVIVASILVSALLMFLIEKTPFARAMAILFTGYGSALSLESTVEPADPERTSTDTNDTRPRGRTKRR
jgi:potassium/hydrogen antiporter